MFWFLVGLVHLVSGCDGGVMLGMLEVSGEGVAVRCSVWECAVHTVHLSCVSQEWHGSSPVGER